MHRHHTGEGKFVHKDRGPREPRNSDFWSGKRKKFALANLLAIGMLQVLFLANLANFYGSAFEDSGRVHNFKVLLVDYDTGVVSQALQAAYQRLRSDEFPTLIRGNAADYPNQLSLTNEVCHNRHIYALLYTHAGASDRLSAAIGGGEGAATYNSSDAISYIWNGVRYNTFGQSEVAANLQQLITASGVAYANLNGTYAYESVNTSSPQAVTAVAQPFTPSDIDLMPTNQGARVFYNTVTIVMTIVSQFFYCLAMNGIGNSFQMFTRLSVTRNLYIRWASGLIYSAGLAATLTGIVWSFREDWPVNSAQGVETWLTYTFVCNIHFLIFDTITGFIPIPFVPYFVLTWILINVTSAIVPLELTPGFYKWQYALPTYEAYQLLVTIWSHGCVPQLFRALPVLFAWWIVSLIGSWFSMIQKCNAATHLEGEVEEALEDTIDEKEEEETLRTASTTPPTDQTKTEPRDGDGDTSSDSNSNTAVQQATSADLARRKTRDRVMESIMRNRGNADALWLSAPTPFQDRLGLTPVWTAPAGATDRRPGLNGRLNSRPRVDA